MEKETTTVADPAVAAGTGAAAGTGTDPGAAPGAVTGTDPGAAAGAAAQEKTYDQAYIDRLLADQKAAQDAAVKEALKVAGMDAKSKETYEKEQAEKRLAEREADIARRELLADAREVLKEKDVPAEFLEMLAGKDLKETKENADAFKIQFDRAVQAQVEKRLAGKTPSAGTGSGALSETEKMAAEIAQYMG